MFLMNCHKKKMTNLQPPLSKSLITVTCHDHAGLYHTPPHRARFVHWLRSQYYVRKPYHPL